MSQKNVVAALQELEQAWSDICNASIQMTFEEFERRMKALDAKKGTTHSDAWMQMAKRVLECIDEQSDQRTRNLILAECNPPNLRKYSNKFNHALSELVGLVEWAYADVKTFVEDPNKDELLRRFAWFRVFLVAEAYHKEGKYHKQGKVVDLHTLMPRVVFKRVK